MLRRLAIALMVAGLSLLGLAGYQVADRERHQAVEQRQLELTLLRARPQPAEGRKTQTVGARARASQGAAWGRLEISRVGLSVVLDEGIDGPTLRRAVGHLPGTAFPGENGNVVLAGHRDSFFRPLRLVREGDRMRVTTPDGVFDYEITSIQIVRPERTDVLDPGRGQDVTLVTCYPFYYVGPAPLRYIVKARPVAGEQQAGGGTAGGAAPASADLR